MKAICSGCGTQQAYEADTLPPTSSCSACPPRLCDGCGQMDHLDNPCSCWVSLEGMPHADVKALFARDGLSLGVPTDD